ncbi:MAG: ferritin family protein [Nitrospiraceae bacterium]|nr:ferritin family protein [Nitrospiraceae bacterium]MDA8089708.1 ferritin family protein [Nitrospiraceae bacterium]
MADFFNAFEIFEIAEQIERNGGAFYRKAAEAAEDEELGGVLLQLASMEDDHIKVFSSMKEELEGQPWAQGFEQENEAVLFLRAMASGKVFGDRKDLVELAGDMSMTDILDKAISLEKDSIAFYTGIKELVPAEFGKGRIDAIIKEEMRHVRILSERLASMPEF